jgi:hypothetical protein
MGHDDDTVIVSWRMQGIERFPPALSKLCSNDRNRGVPSEMACLAPRNTQRNGTMIALPDS